MEIARRISIHAARTGSDWYLHFSDGIWNCYFAGRYPECSRFTGESGGLAETAISYLPACRSTLLGRSLAFFCEYWNSTHDFRYAASLYSKYLVFEVSSCLRDSGGLYGCAVLDGAGE